MTASMLRKLRRLLTLTAFAAALIAALVTLRLQRPDLGVSLLRGAAVLLVAGILVSLGIPRTRCRRPFDPRAGRMESER
ncbi:hypothetical protein JXA88_03215 [Candidatus Fermentibacteria bacterium]|nr:hypothetical protein [Candidatus Fermentibacteria bacterium]